MKTENVQHALGGRAERTWESFVTARWHQRLMNPLWMLLLRERPSLGGRVMDAPQLMRSLVKMKSGSNTSADQKND